MPRCARCSRNWNSKSWLAELGGVNRATLSAAGTVPSIVSTQPYETILDDKALDAWIQTSGKTEAFAFDTETTSLDAMQAQIVGVSFADRAGHAAYVAAGARLPGCAGAAQARRRA